jgi:CRP-like cAMP-binding protein
MERASPRKTRGLADTDGNMGDDGRAAPSSVLGGLPAAERAHAARVLAACRERTLESRVPHFRGAFPNDAFLAIETGFVVLRASTDSASRSVITCEAGPGRLAMPPSPEEVLVALTTASVFVVDATARAELLKVPAIAERIVEQLTHALERKQAAIANMASPRHAERLRRRLLQLGETYGHVVRDGIRIDFPLSHALLAEMIGSSRETVTRALDELQRSGFVARDGGTYRLLVSPATVAV